MGIPKHGKDSSRTKNSKKYKEGGRRALNKIRKQLRHEKRLERFRNRRKKKGE